MYDELVKALRETDFSYGCPCGAELLCKDKDCVIIQAADAIEELQGRAKVLEKVADKWCEAVPKWIPVTERLPEPYSGEYLVTINDGSVYTDILWFDSPGDGRYESCFYKTDDDGYGVVCDDVIAWMPLPQPYKGERKDDE